MAYFALMTREQFGKSRSQLRNVIKSSKGDKEFLCRLNPGQDVENATILTHDEMEDYIASDPLWGGSSEEDVDLSSMTKAELITLAQDRDIELPEKATKAKIIAALEGN